MVKPNLTKEPTDANEEQAVLVFLSRTSPCGTAYTPDALVSLEEALAAAIVRHGVGEFDGDEIGLQSGDVTLYMYGPDAEALFAAIEEILRRNPLTHGAQVVLRKGGPGSMQRDIRI